MNKIKNFGIKKIAIIIVSMILLTGVAYASVTIARDGKSTYLPWQGTPSLFYNSAHNVGDSYQSSN
ncbi:MAG: hypothetical protein Q9M97_00895 [Candidatus Gracilibacteria bacterium]|nr:hypothetical protein [Candidatus Gracilibacteria bacterium]